MFQTEKRKRSTKTLSASISLGEAPRAAHCSSEGSEVRALAAQDTNHWANQTYHTCKQKSKRQETLIESD